MFRRKTRPFFSMLFILLMAIWMIRDGIMPMWSLAVFGFMFISYTFFGKVYTSYRLHRRSNKTRRDQFSGV